MQSLKLKIAKKTGESTAAAQDFLQSKGTEYHTYVDKTNVVKGVLSVTMDVATTTANLCEEGIIIIHLLQSRRGPARVLPLYLAKVAPMQRKALYKVYRLIGLVVRIEKLKQITAPILCFRCQRFDNTKTHCHLQQRYIMCAGGH